MGTLFEGVWQQGNHARGKRNGRFVRETAGFRNWITVDGSRGPTGDGGFKAQADRYHLYISYACPWCHRCAILHALKGLDGIVGISTVRPRMLDNGWSFLQEDGSSSDAINQKRYLHEIYTLASPYFTGRATVPVLWDRHRQTIVNNESADIMRMLADAFDRLTPNRISYRPPALVSAIDALNREIYKYVNNGVYRCGLATTQEAYQEALDRLFAMLDRLEEWLDRQRYLTGDTTTEADWRLLPTLVRFDAVYYPLFKCNLKRIAEYPNLSNYLRDLYQTELVPETARMDEIKAHYFGSHLRLNPGGVVPAGPLPDFAAPHDRARFS